MPICRLICVSLWAVLLGTESVYGQGANNRSVLGLDSLSASLENSIISSLRSALANRSAVHLLTAQATVTLQDGLRDVPLVWFALTDDTVLLNTILTTNESIVLGAPAAKRISAPTTTVALITPLEPETNSSHCKHTGPYNVSDPASWPLVFGALSDPEGLQSAQLDAVNISSVAEYALRKHNCLRTKVTPSASNMLKMRWNKEVAAQAQDWANLCQYKHNNQSDRTTSEYQCGQNIAYSTPWPFSWNAIINMWFSEYKEYKYGEPNDLHIVGHYTAMSWATTYELGCGYKDCGGWHYYVCNYCPSGNYGDLSIPYKSGKPCSECPDSCDDGLCTNSCPFSNVYSNCDELQRKYKICSNPFQKDAAESCKATCRCPGKIYQ